MSVWVCRRQREHVYTYEISIVATPGVQVNHHSDNRQVYKYHATHKLPDSSEQISRSTER